ncbi:MAG: DNA alkylation repair protein [Candidatus Saccharibacteria bacterium]|nr:DNA alkylation repair protein [Candidatus Saccharibacteria bacterium]
MNLSNELVKLTDTTYLKTNKTTIPTNWPMLGVRIPEIKKLVQKIPKEEIPKYLETKPANHEEILARGFLIARLPYEEMLEYFDSQVSLFDNWCTVDTFCAALRKSVKKNEADFLEHKVKPLLKSRKEFETRTGLVCLLDLFMNEEYIPIIFESIESLKDRNEYYVKMAAAWLLAECYIKFRSKTEVFMHKTELNDWTYKKTISKICDSYRVDEIDKRILKESIR